MRKDWNNSDCGLLKKMKREETELIYWKFSGCVKVYQPLHSTASLFCRLLLAPEDIHVLLYCSTVCDSHVFNKCNLLACLQPSLWKTDAV